MSEALPPVDVRLSLGDYYVLHFQAWRHWGTIIGLLLILFTASQVIGPLMEGVPFIYWHYWIDWSFAAILLVVLVAVYFVMPLAQWRSQQKLLERGVRYQISPQGVSSRLEHQRGTFDWPMIKRVVVKSDRLLLFINRCSAVILPRRVFASDDEFIHYVTSAKAWHEAANKGEG